MSEAPPELLSKVAKAIGAIPVRNTGVIGYASPLRSELSQRMIDAIAAAAIETTLDWLEFKSVEEPMICKSRREAVQAAVRMNQVDPRGGWRAERATTRRGWWTIVAN